MADINSLKSNIYGVLFEPAIDELPSIQFNSAAVDIASAVNTLGDAMEIRLNGNINEKDKTAAIIKQTLETYDSLKQCPEHAQCFTPLNKIASKLGENILNIFNILKTSVNPEVESLKEAIESRSKVILKESTGRISFEPSSELATDIFEVINWDEHIGILGGPEAVLSAFKDVSGTEANFIPSDLNLIAGSPAMTIQDMSNINPETKADILNRVKAKATETMEIEKALDIVMNSYDFQGMVATTIGRIANSNEYHLNINSCISYIAGLYPLLSTIKSTPLDVTDEVLEVLTSNIDTVERALRVAGYALLIIRKHYEGVLIISNNMLNGDELPKYLNDGGSKEDIARYVYVFHTTKNIPIPFGGITAEEINNNKSDTDTKYTAQVEADKISTNATKHRITIEAARQVMTEHLESTDATRLPMQMNLEEFIKIKKPYIQTLLNQLDTNADNNLTSMLYEFVINLWYDGTMVRTAHEIFGIETIKQLEANPDLTDESYALIDATVAATLISKFIVKELIVQK